MRLIDADSFNRKIEDEYHGALSDSIIHPYEVLRMIDQMPIVNQWISLDERFPDCADDVLISYYIEKNGKRCRGNFVDIASWHSGDVYGEGYWIFYSDEYLIPGIKVHRTAWMPLPTPYKENKK